jgi:hypothetical protein
MKSSASLPQPEAVCKPVGALMIACAAAGHAFVGRGADYGGRVGRAGPTCPPALIVWWWAQRCGFASVDGSYGQMKSRMGSTGNWHWSCGTPLPRLQKAYELPGRLLLSQRASGKRADPQKVVPFIKAGDLSGLKSSVDQLGSPENTPSRTAADSASMGSASPSRRLPSERARLRGAT